MLPSIRITLLVATAAFFCACATTPEARVERAKRFILKQPFEQWPTLYAKYERDGTITPEIRKVWMESWTTENNKRVAARIAYEKEVQKQIEARKREERRLAAERKRIWDSLTPAQKLDFEMRQRELAQQQAFLIQQQANMDYQIRAQRQANIAAAFQNMSQNLQNQQMINAYNQRTQVLSRPVNVNVNGNINHTFNQGYFQPAYGPYFGY